MRLAYRKTTMKPESMIGALLPSKNPRMKPAPRQYLSPLNHYQRHLIRLAEAGFRFIVECTAEGCEPHYEGATEEDAAQDIAAQRESDTGFSHGVFCINVEDDGSVWTDYKHL